jgi:hypothetical protein
MYFLGSGKGGFVLLFVAHSSYVFFPPFWKTLFKKLNSDQHH